MFRSNWFHLQPDVSWPWPEIYQLNIPANTKHLANVGTMLGQRRRRWANIVPTLVSVNISPFSAKQDYNRNKMVLFGHQDEMSV